MPRGFAYPNFAEGGWAPAALWQPIAVFQATHPALTLRGLHVDSRAVLRLRAGTDSTRAAAAMLERATPQDALPVLRMIPRHALTPKLAEILASALIDAGRYRDARDAAQIVTGDAHELLLARIERRTGDYGPALTRLDRLATRGFDAAILRADLLYVDSRYNEMRAALAECAPATTKRERNSRISARCSRSKCASRSAIGHQTTTT